MRGHDFAFILKQTVELTVVIVSHNLVPETEDVSDLIHQIPSYFVAQGLFVTVAVINET